MRWQNYFILFLFITATAVAQHDVLTQHFDQKRTGWHNQETILTTKNIKPGFFGKLFTRVVDDQIYAQPLVVQASLPTIGTRNLIITATVNNTVYAFDADSAIVSLRSGIVNYFLL